MRLAMGFLLILSYGLCFAARPAFQIIPLGVKGGVDVTNLSSYLIAPIEDDHFVALDAGSLLPGINRALKSPGCKKLHVMIGQSQHADALAFLRKQVVGYLISHAHLDHIAGMVIDSPEDSSKFIMGLSTTIHNLKVHVFNNVIWPNFSNQGKLPLLNRYQYIVLQPDEWKTIPRTQMYVQAFILTHGKNYTSTAFLIRYKKNYLLYFGDTGDDKIQAVSNIQKVWQAVAPLIKEHRLNTLMIESSYDNARSDNELYGHLKPALLFSELTQLAKIVDPKNPKEALRGIKVIVLHIKPVAGRKRLAEWRIIKNELIKGNTLDVNFVIPIQGNCLLI